MKDFNIIGRSASVSDCGKYRYTLSRRWECPTNLDMYCTFIMLNPSTADAFQEDPTIRKCMKFARRLGCNGLHVINLYAYRATDPNELLSLSLEERIGPENLRVISSELSDPTSFPVICAWGSHKAVDKKIVKKVIQIANNNYVNLKALHINKDGNPKHPLYCRDDSELIDFDTVIE